MSLSRNTTVALTFLLTAAALLLAGCGPANPPRVMISGTVAVEGQPLDEGFISFDPANGQGSAYGGEIRDGRFALECETGRKIVAIRASRPSSRPGPDGGPDYEQYLPAKYNTASELTADIIANGPHQFSFDLNHR